MNKPLAAFAGSLFLLAAVLGTAPPQGKILEPDHVAAYNQTEQILIEIRDDLRGLRQDLRGALAKGEIRSDGAAVLRNRCATCHQDGAASKGAKTIVLVDREDGVPGFSALEKKHILEQIRANKMPPNGPPLSEGEKKAVDVYLSSEQKGRNK